MNLHLNVIVYIEEVLNIIFLTDVVSARYSSCFASPNLDVLKVLDCGCCPKDCP